MGGRRFAYMKEFQMIAHYMHDRIVEMCGYRVAGPKPILSTREMTCLELVARGVAPKQIAGRLQISDRAVRLFLNSGCTKLGCANTHQAIAKMVSLDWRLARPERLLQSRHIFEEPTMKCGMINLHTTLSHHFFNLPVPTEPLNHRS
jgi:DNA-binding CsgD family transcriptional regulator